MPARIDALATTAAQGFRAVPPLEAVDQRLFALCAPPRSGPRVGRGWSFGNSNRWDPAGPDDLPASRPLSPPSLEIHSMLAEHRSEAFNLTNASEAAAFADASHRRAAWRP